MNVMTCYSVKNIVEKLFLLFMMGFAFCACGDDESYTLGVWHVVPILTDWHVAALRVLQ